MQVAILGELEVRADGRVVEIAGIRLRVLIGRLAMDAGQSIPTSVLIDCVWAEDPPANAKGALQTLVSRARRLLGDGGRIEPTPVGYVLQVPPQNIDAQQFLDLARTGAAQLAAGDAAAEPTLREALGLWRGPLLADAGDAEFAVALRARWDELRLTAYEDLLAARLAVGGADPVLSAEIADAAALHPIRDRLAVLLLEALHAEGRVPEALEAFETIKARLADVLGADPSPALHTAHARLLSASDADAPLRPRALPVGRSSFIGRDDDVAAARAQLSRSRLVTLLGPGGAGKTRMAIETAREVPGTADGVWLVELAGVVGGALDLAQFVLSSLGVRDTRLLDRRGQVVIERSGLDRLEDAFADRAALIVLDNCEHVIEAAAALVDELLSRCPGLRVLATSREPLSIAGESIFPVRPLGVPDGDEFSADLADYPALRLFIERAEAAQPGFALDAATAPAVIEICRRLDGLPLALELAAARLRTLTVDQVARRLGDRFGLLSSGSRAALPRHRTLRAVVAWSWDLLDDAERDLMERLSVFGGGIEADAAAQVCGGGEDLLTRLADLADKSLLTPVETADLGPQAALGAEPRFRMLETIREFGIERLAERGIETAARDAHAAVFHKLAMDAEPHMRSSEQLRWLRMFDRERDNLLAALTQLAARGRAADAIAMTLSLSWFWTLVGAHSMASTWLGIALSAEGEVAAEDQAAATILFIMNSSAMGWMGEPSEDLGAARRVLAVADPDTQKPMVLLMRIIAAVFMEIVPPNWAADDAPVDRGPIEDTAALIERGKASLDPWMRAACTLIQGNVAENDGHVALARECFESALAAFEIVGERWGLGNTLIALARVQAWSDNPAECLDTFARAAEILTELGAGDDVALSSLWSAQALLRLDRIDEAQIQRDIASRLVEDTASTHGPAMLAQLDASLAYVRGDLAGARNLAREAVALCEDGEHAPPQVLSIVMAQLAGLLVEGPGAEPDAAAQLAGDALRIAVRLTDMPVLSLVAVGAAAVLAGRDELEAAACALSLADTVRGVPDTLSPEVRGVLSRVTARLTERQVAEARAGGQVSRAEAISQLTALADRLAPASDPAAVGANGQRKEHRQQP